MSNQLDATNIKARGEKLVQEVVNRVGRSQDSVLTPLPGSVLFTKEQIETITDYLMYTEQYNQFTDKVALIEDRLLRTPYNVMEVVVA